MSQGGEASAPSLLDEALSLGVRKGPTCDVERFYVHKPELAAQLREALAADVATTAICAALKKRGIDIAPHTLQRHRRAQCKCQTY